MDLRKGADTERPAPKQGIFGAADAPAGLAPAYVPPEEDFAEKFVRKQAEAVEREVMHTKRVAEEEDALDAFMDAEVKPTVQATEEAVRVPRGVAVLRSGWTGVTVAGALFVSVPVCCLVCCIPVTVVSES